MVRRCMLAGAVAAVLLVSPSLTRAAGAWRSGHPPTLVSAQIDSQRRLVVTYSAPDGVTYGGSLYLDNNARDAQPVSSDPTYGPIMYCNNNSSCLGRWTLAATPSSGPLTYTTEQLDPQRFPAGTYYVQVDTTNEDPFVSTRQEEFSNIVTVVVPAKGGGGTTTTTTANTEPAGKPAVTFVVHGETTIITKDGEKRVSGGSVSLSVGDWIKSGSRAVTLAIEEGRLVVAPNSEFLIGAQPKRPWVLIEGTARFAGKDYTILGTSAVVRTIGVAAFTVESCVHQAGSPYCGNRVRAYSGKVDVSRDLAKKPADKKHLVLEAGFETFLGSGPPMPAKKFKPPPHPFWNP